MGFFDLFTDPIGTIESALTPKGSHAAESQTERNAQMASLASSLIPMWQDLYGMGTNDKGYATKRTNAINALIEALNPANMMSEASGQKNALYSSAAKSSAQATNAAKASGLGSAYQAGQQASIMGDAARNSALLDSQYLDPQKKASRVSAWLAAIEQGQKIPGLSDLSQLANIIYGQPTVQVQQGLGNVLGNLAGGLLGGSTGSSVGSILTQPTPENTGGIIETPDFNSQAYGNYGQSSYGPYSTGYRWG